jgi:cell division protein FtsW
MQGRGWQGSQAQIAVGSGGFWGLGLGQSRQKHLYLPEPANDFIFAVMCEEFGFLITSMIVIVFALLIWRGYYIASHAGDRFGTLLAAGITTQIAVQVIINLFVVTGIFPVTGASLPFFSYGGTSLVMLLGEVGVLLSVSRSMPPSKGE